MTHPDVRAEQAHVDHAYERLEAMRASASSMLAEAFSEAADEEKDPERKSRLRQIASFLGETGKDVVAEVIAKVFLHGTGMG